MDMPPTEPTFSDDHLLTRSEAARFAAALGYPIAVATLAKYAWRGGADAPEIVYFGARKPLYRVGDFKAWLVARTTRARSTAEFERRRAGVR